MVRDRDLFGILGALVLVDVTLLVTWLVLHPPSRNVVVAEEDTRVRLGCDPNRQQRCHYRGLMLSRADHLSLLRNETVFRGNAPAIFIIESVSK